MCKASHQSYPNTRLEVLDGSILNLTFEPHVRAACKINHRCQDTVTHERNPSPSYCGGLMLVAKRQALSCTLSWNKGKPLNIAVSVGYYSSPWNSGWSMLFFFLCFASRFVNVQFIIVCVWVNLVSDWDNVHMGCSTEVSSQEGSCPSTHLQETRAGGGGGGWAFQ